MYLSPVSGVNLTLKQKLEASLLLLNFWAVQKKTQIDERQGGTPHDTPLCVNLCVLHVCVCELSRVLILADNLRLR